MTAVIQEKVNRQCSIIYLVWLTACLVLGLLYSIDWPVTNDAIVFKYILWRIEEGGVPYRDIYETNMPGTYMVQQFFEILLGKSDLAFRIFDLTFLFASCAIIIGMHRHISWQYAVIGALFFANVHLANGVNAASQRDFLMTALLLGSAWMLKDFLTNPHAIKRLFFLGLLCGCAFWIKPTAIIFLGLSLLLIAYAIRSIKKLAAIVLVIAAGFLVPTLFVHLWLYHMQATGAFYDMFFHFLLPIYSKSESLNVLSLPNILLVVIMVAALYKISHIPYPDNAIYIIGIMYGIIHFCTQAKGWFYHFYPLWGFFWLYMSRALPTARFTMPGNAVLLHAIFFLYAYTLWPADRGDAAHIRQEIAMITQDVDTALTSVPEQIKMPYLAGHPDQYVHFFDFTHAHLFNAAYHNKWVAPSRHNYMFALYNHEWNYPYIQGLAKELEGELQQAKPLVILVSSEAWPWLANEAKSYTIIDTQTPWKDFFSTHYRLYKQSEHYRVYARIQ